MSTDQPTATATPIYRFSLASWLSIYGRTCLMDFVKETDYATLERELSSAQAALAEAKAEVARLIHDKGATNGRIQSQHFELTSLRAEVLELKRLLGEVYRNTNLRHHPELTGLADIVSNQLSQ